uniref:Uncharacterized protein n=1 Tax=Daphnia magna TaxID=35525 RepID=A0A0P6GDF1_9CRUS
MSLIGDLCLFSFFLFFLFLVSFFFFPCPFTPRMFPTDLRHHHKNTKEEITRKRFYRN